MIYLTAIGLTPGGSSTHLHTNNTQNNTNKKIHRTTHYRRKTINRTTQLQYTEQHEACSNYSQKLSFDSSLFSLLGAGTLKTMTLHQRPLRSIYSIS